MSRPERVTVMAARTRQAQGSGRPAGRSAPIPSSDAGDAARLAVLLRVHRRLAVQTMSLVLVVLLGLPLVLSFLPDLTGTTLLGLPVLWWLLGVGIYPAILITGRWHAGRAERVDDELR
jgi:uncharacterized membrane protein (DUF485 family)